MWYEILSAFAVTGAVGVALYPIIKEWINRRRMATVVRLQLYPEVLDVAKGCNDKMNVFLSKTPTVTDETPIIIQQQEKKRLNRIREILGGTSYLSRKECQYLYMIYQDFRSGSFNYQGKKMTWKHIKLMKTHADVLAVILTEKLADSHKAKKKIKDFRKHIENQNKNTSK